MRKTTGKHLQTSEFADFMEAPDMAPRPATDAAVRRLAQVGQSVSARAVVGRFIGVQAAAGLLTLTICPQFGIGFGDHNVLLHDLHAQVPPALYYLTCGVLFVLLGALINGLIANRRELKAIGRGTCLLAGGYSLGAYLVLLLAGSESFLLMSLFWIIGAVAAQLAGFTLGWRLRFSAFS